MNEKIIREEILKKNSPTPYYVDNTIFVINNKYDTFPYPGWFVSDVKSDKATVAEREAGWIPKNRFKPKIPREEDPKPTFCFQNACSIVYPCYAQDSNYISSNKGCLSEKGGHQ